MSACFAPSRTYALGFGDRWMIYMITSSCHAGCGAAIIFTSTTTFHFPLSTSLVVMATHPHAVILTTPEEFGSTLALIDLMTVRSRQLYSVNQSLDPIS